MLQGGQAGTEICGALGQGCRNGAGCMAKPPLCMGQGSSFHPLLGWRRGWYVCSIPNPVSGGETLGHLAQGTLILALGRGGPDYLGSNSSLATAWPVRLCLSLGSLIFLFLCFSLFLMFLWCTYITCVFLKITS